MSLTSLCDKLVDIYPKVEARGSAGGRTVTWPTKSASVRARIQPTSMSEQTLALQRGSSITHVLYFTADPSIGNGDEVRFGTRVFRAESDAIDFDEQGRLWKVRAEEQEQNQ